MSAEKHTDTSKKQRQPSESDSLPPNSKKGDTELTEEDLRRISGGKGLPDSYTLF